MYPFKQNRKDGYLIREFSKDTNPADLVWHRDRNDRVIKVISSNGWLFQRDNSIPKIMESGDIIEIKANEWHRIIKGSDTNLVITIREGSNKKLSKKQKKIAQAAPPPDEITGDDFKALRKSKKDVDEIAVKSRMRRQNDMDGYSSGNLKSILEDESVEEAKKRKKRKKKKPSDNKQYARGRTAANKKGLDAAVAAYNRAKKTPGKADDMAAIRKREKFAEGKEPTVISENQLGIMINDIVEEIKLDAVLNEIEDRIDEKKKKKRKKKKSGSRKLSKAVKKSLDKKADKRCLTRGSVYAEFRAGLGAFYTSGSRKGMAPHQWAHARVNSANPSKKWAKVKKRKKCLKKKK